MSLKKEVVSLLEEIAELMEFDGQNSFKINAFKNGANIIRRLEGDLEEKINDGSIKDVKGIGKGLQQVIYEYYETGSTKIYEELILKVPSGIHNILQVRGLGAKKVKLLYDKLGIDSFEKLEQNCKNGKIASLKGFSNKTVEKILIEVNRIKKSHGFMLLSTAIDRSKKIITLLSKLDSIEKIEPTGEIRRVREIISRIELICLISERSFGKNEKMFLKDIANLFIYNEIESTSLYKLYNLSNEETGAFRLYVVSGENYDEILLQTTGTIEFLNEIRDPENLKFKSENDYFKSAQFRYVIPEMREKEYFNLPENLREQSDLSLEHFKGFFHFHTTYSDGNNTLPEMVNQTEQMGFSYAVVCDHSKSAFYANGLKEDRVFEQRKEIDEFNKSSSIKVYHGIESDILKNGSLDYAEEILSGFQFIVASIHSLFNLTEEEMTKRIIKAVENPFTDILAHPTGRLLLTRDGYKVDIKKVIDACAANEVAIEINANPHRLDLDWRNLFYARKKGCLITINPDAHSIEGINEINYGIMIARKAGVKSNEILNCFNEKDFVKFINRKVKRNI